MVTPFIKTLQIQGGTFYTFSSVSYLADVYARRLPPERHLGREGKRLPARKAPLSGGHPVPRHIALEERPGRPVAALPQAQCQEQGGGHRRTRHYRPVKVTGCFRAKATTPLRKSSV